MWNEHAWMAEGSAPARDIGRGRYGRNTIYFPSIKNNTQLVCESALEADYCIWLEWDSDVKAYYPQPYTFRWTCKKEKMRYTPDFYVIHLNSPNHFTEVKPDFNRTSNKFKLTLESFIAHDDHKDVHLKLADCTSIHQPIRLQNLKLLYNRLHRITGWEVNQLHEFLLTHDDSLTINECLASRHPPSIRALSMAIFTGELVTNLNTPLTPQAMLTKRSGS
ncbi:hypothetical protein ACYZT3_08935 [Pseudomonas sp. MDT1-16]